MRQFAALAALATTGAVLGADRMSATEKGSLLIYSGAQGTIHISNDYPADVRLQSYIVNDACQSYDMAFSLTANQITAFSTDDLAAPFGDGGMAASVSMYVWAVNGDNAQIRWNHLSGGVIGAGAYASAAVVGDVAHGDEAGEPGFINLDGVMYSSAYNGATYNFVADADMLTIELLDHDFADKNAADPNTKIVAEIWNENEVKFSGTSRCVSCIESAGISGWSDSAVNFFRESSLGTSLGKARLSTEANASCGSTDNPSSERAFFASSGGFGSVAGTGTRSATITYELESEPEEAGKRVRKAFGLLRK